MRTGQVLAATAFAAHGQKKPGRFGWCPAAFRPCRHPRATGHHRIRRREVPGGREREYEDTPELRLDERRHGGHH